MFIDARQIPPGKVIETDVCVVGAGAAGISFALEFANTSTDVCLLEAGGFELDGATQALNQGVIAGRDYHPLVTARQRFFGGTTNCWHGWCRPLEEIDFEERPYIPYSGWPITLSDLEPHYGKAWELCELKHDNGKPQVSADGLPSFFTEQVPRDKRVQTAVWQISPPTLFGKKYRDTIEKTANIHTYLYANVVEIETNDDATTATQLRIGTLQGTEFWIRAKYFVLAGGGIEVPRLLLASNSRNPAGLGNNFDQLGRYFMLHPHLWVGRILTTEPIDNMVDQRTGKNWKWKPVRVGVGISPEQQKAERLPNHVMLLREASKKEAPDEGIGALVSAMAEKAYNKLLGRPEVHTLHLLLWTDHMPNPDSRVTLGSEKDALGVPRPVLDWRLTPGEKKGVRRTVELFGQVLGTLNVGRMQLDEWLLADDDVWPEDLEGDYHHMGATRMSSDPRNGVVDANCRVHGVDNVYVASSSVFATAGSSNPTLTIIAMAVRLAGHIKQAMST